MADQIAGVNIADVIRQGGADVAASTGAIGQTLLGIGSEVQRQGKEKELMQMKREQLQMQKEEHGLRVTAMQNQFTGEFVSKIADFDAAESDIQKQIDEAQAKMSVLSKGTVTSDTPTIAGTVAAQGSDAQVEQQTAFKDTSLEVSHLQEMQKQIRNAKQAALMNTLRNPTAVAALLRSDYNNSALGEIFTKGFENADPEIKTEAAKMLSEVGAAHRYMEEQKAQKQLQATLGLDMLKETQKANIEVQKQLILKRADHEYKMADKEVDEGKPAKSLAYSSFAGFMKSLFPEDDAGNPIYTVEDSPTLSTLLALRESAEAMMPGVAQKDAAVMRQQIEEAFTTDAEGEVTFDQPTFLTTVHSDDVVSKFSSPDSPYLGMLQLFATRYKDTSRKFRFGFGTAAQSASEKVVAANPGMKPKAKAVGTPSIIETLKGKTPTVQHITLPSN